MNILQKLIGTEEPVDTHTKTTAAPVVQEKVHNEYEHIDKTKVEEIHDRTEVVQTIQPIHEEKTESTDRSTVDHGTEVHEHGKSGLTAGTEAELAARREDVKEQYSSSHDEKVTEREERPDIERNDHLNVVEEIVPVVEREVYRPHEVEHTKKIIELHHEEPKIAGTQVAEPVSIEEWKKTNSEPALEQK